MDSRAFPDDRIAWPPYFRPHAGHERPSGAGDDLLPVNLVDVFFLRGDDGAEPSLIAVAGCLGGNLAVFAGPALSALAQRERTLADQLQAIRVARRDVFRVVTARELFLAAVDAVEQPASTAGFNDPVYLHGTMQARLVAGDPLEVLPLRTRGRLTVGRLDLLHAFAANLSYALEGPHAPDERVFHLLVPLGTVSDVEQGTALALVYPLLDPAIAPHAGNDFIVLQIVYDLLTGLQQDMRRSGHTNSFVDVRLAVPNRGRLEEELVLDGYVVDGGVATKRPDDAGAAGQTPVLDRLRAWTASWSQPRIEIPLQATPHDYAAMIPYLLRVLGSADDARMARALDGRVQARLSATRGRPHPSERTEPAARSRSAPPPDPPPSRSTSPSRPAPGTGADFARDFRPAAADRGERNDRDWSGDFGPRPAPVTPPAPAPRGDRSAYAGDFGLPGQAEAPSARGAAVTDGDRGDPTGDEPASRDQPGRPHGG